MPSNYNPSAHIQRLAIAPREEGVLDQREVTIQSYQTTIPFDFDVLARRIEKAWLSPKIKFGVFAQTPITGNDALNVVLGLQDELTIRAYDYDERTPVWFSWQNIVVDTVNIRYYQGGDGFLRFTTTGGGRRITDDRLQEFNSRFLRIPKDAVTKQHFDLSKLRDLCFSRFVDRLYMLRFTDPSGIEYRSIDHALFQSRKYIDPKVKRLQEVRADEKVKIESFDSDIVIHPPQLSKQAPIRFFLRGISGSLRIRFPKLYYKSQVTTVEEQTKLFYQIVDASVQSILDADYYVQHRYSLDDLDTNLSIFPDMIDLEPFKKVLMKSDTRDNFIMKIQPNDIWSEWQPHLRAIDELLQNESVTNDIVETLTKLSKSRPQVAAWLLSVCLADAKLHRIGSLLARAMSTVIRYVQADLRVELEHVILTWAMECESDSWGIDEENEQILVFDLCWKPKDVAVQVLPLVLDKLIALLHCRLMDCNDDVYRLLGQMNWCLDTASQLPSNHSSLPSAIRLVAENLVPKTLGDAGKILERRVDDLRHLDDAVLEQFGLPLWPHFSAMRDKKSVQLVNTGSGTVWSLQAKAAGAGLFSEHSDSTDIRLECGESIDLPLNGRAKSLDVQFTKYGKDFFCSVPVIRENTVVQTQNNDDYEVAKQAELIRATKRVLGHDECPNPGTVSNAVRDRKIDSNMKSGHACLVSVQSYKAWIVKQRHLDNEEAQQIADAITSEIRVRLSKRKSKLEVAQIKKSKS